MAIFIFCVLSLSLSLTLLYLGAPSLKVELLLRYGCRLDVANDTGYTPVILAACGGYIHMIEWLVLTRHCSLWTRTADGDSALLLACYCGHTNLVAWILDHGGSLSERNNTGLTPLLSAVNGGHINVVELLLQRGSCIEETDNEGFSPLLLAAYRDHVVVWRTLLLCGASLLSRTIEGLDCTALAPVTSRVRRWLAYLSGLPPLHIAALLRSTSRVHHLLSEGHNPHMSAISPACGALTALDAAILCVDIPDAPSLQPDLVHLLRAAMQPWAPHTHRLFGPTYRQRAVFLMAVWYRLWDNPTVPRLPREVWLYILSFLDRDIDVPNLCSHLPRKELPEIRGVPTTAVQAWAISV